MDLEKKERNAIRSCPISSSTDLELDTSDLNVIGYYATWDEEAGACFIEAEGPLHRQCWNMRVNESWREFGTPLQTNESCTLVGCLPNQSTPVDIFTIGQLETLAVTHWLAPPPFLKQSITDR